MVRLTPEMRDLVQRCQLAFIATADDEGKPNVAPKGSIGVLDDETLFYIELAGAKTFENLKKNAKVAVAVIDMERRRPGYQFKGVAELVYDGPLYEEALRRISEISRRIGRELPKPKAVVKIKITEIYQY